MTRLEATAQGLVQGVFFRHFTRLRAQTLGLSGTVTNCQDGSVRIVAEGPRDALEALLLWLHTGPELAVVRHVESHWRQPSGSFEGFDILR